MFFESVLGLEGLTGEQKCCCPFPHTRQNGETYTDEVPSLSINLDKRVYNCHSCGAKGNEVQFCAKLFNTTTTKANNFITMLNKGATIQDVYEALEEQPKTEAAWDMLNELGITKEVIDTCMVDVQQNGEFWDWDIPVMWYDKCIDIRHYRPGRTPKVYGEKGAPVGTIIPHDLWISELHEKPNRTTILCAGEKDMLVTRSRGFSAVTFTGGEMLQRPLDVTEFRGRRIAICYDNDEAGRLGAVKMAKVLHDAGAHVKIVTGFHADFKSSDTKEDLTDWFVKYGGTSEKLIKIINETPTYTPESVEEAEDVPTVTIAEAIKAENFNKKLRTKVQVLTVTDEAYEIPKTADVKKVTNDIGVVPPGTVFKYDLYEDPVVMFGCLGKSMNTCKEAIRAAFVPKTEKGVAVYPKDTEVVYACTVAEVNADFESMQELTMFCIGIRPVQGKVYDCEYQRTTNTTTGTVCGITSSLVASADALTNFELTEETKSSLLSIQHTCGTVEDKIKHRAKAVRGLLGYKADLDMIIAIDLTFNSVKEFKYGSIQHIKGFLDTLIIGESRVGKSDTAKHLRDAYNLGAFVSLAGSAATIPGLVGGSAKDAMGRMSTRCGVIPRNNSAIICLEEISKAAPEIIKSLTDVRSSGLARITRVSGSVEMPASLRMLSLSNVRPMGDGSTRPISAYSSGIEVVQDLIGTSEDIARYDSVLLVGDPEEINPLYNAEEPYPEQVLQDNIRWVWSRTQDNIIWQDDTEQIIFNLSTELNNKYPLHIKLFGSECWKKIARLAIAAAAYCVSTDDTLQNIVVTPEHARWAASFLEHIYDNNLFKLKDVVRVHRSQTQPDELDTKKLQEYYIKYHVALDMLYEQRKLDKSVFKDLADIDDATYAPIMKCLVARHFVTTDRAYIYTTAKYTATYHLLNKTTEVPRV